MRRARLVGFYAGIATKPASFNISEAIAALIQSSEKIQMDLRTLAVSSGKKSTLDESGKNQIDMYMASILALVFSGCSGI